MNCQSCKVRAASVQFTEVVGDHKRSHWLCAECAHTKGLYVSMQWGDAPSGRPGLSPRCGSCDSTLAAIRRSGRVGCAECYETFAEQLEPLLRRVHGTACHAEGGVATAELARLRAQLRQAVEREDFELAARLRDRLGSLARPGDRGSP